MTFTDDDLRAGLRDIATWGTPASVPPLVDAPVVDLEPAERRRRPTWWAAAAVLLAMAVALATLGSPSTPPIAHGSWAPIAPAPIGPRALAASVWTGTEMIVVGGQSDGGEYLRDAAAYNPHTDSWRRLPDAPVVVHPGAVALWTGQEVAVFNVESKLLTETRESAVIPPLAGPVALDPVTGAWRALAAPGDFIEAATVVNGRIVALAQREWNDPVVLELTDDGWTEMVAPPALTGEAFDFHLLRDWAAVTVGNKAVFISREWMVPGVDPRMSIGFVVDPAARSAVAVAQPGLRARGRSRPTVVRSNVAAVGGSTVLMVAWIVNEDGIQEYDAGTYGVASRTWRRTGAPEELPPFHEVFAAIPMTSAGNDVLVFGGARNRSVVERGRGGVHMVYMADQRRWRQLPAPPVDAYRAGHTAVWTGTELVVWGGLYNRAGASNRLDTPAPDGAVYRPAISRL